MSDNLESQEQSVVSFSLMNTVGVNNYKNISFQNYKHQGKAKQYSLVEEEEQTE